MESLPLLLKKSIAQHLNLCIPVISSGITPDNIGVELAHALNTNDIELYTFIFKSGYMQPILQSDLCYLATILVQLDMPDFLTFTLHWIFDIYKTDKTVFIKSNPVLPFFAALCCGNRKHLLEILSKWGFGMEEFRTWQRQCAT